MSYFCFCLIVSLVSYAASRFCREKIYDYRTKNIEIWEGLESALLAIVIIFFGLTIIPILIFFFTIFIAVAF